MIVLLVRGDELLVRLNLCTEVRETHSLGLNFILHTGFLGGNTLSSLTIWHCTKFSYSSTESTDIITYYGDRRRLPVISSPIVSRSVVITGVVVYFFDERSVITIWLVVIANAGFRLLWTQNQCHQRGQQSDENGRDFHRGVQYPTVSRLIV